MDLLTGNARDERTGGAPWATVAAAGNWFVGHDRIGPMVLEALSGREGEGVELVEAGTSGLALVDRLHGQELFVVVDACVGRGAPGTVTVEAPDLGAPLSGSPSVHQIGPGEALAVAAHLWPERMPGRTRLILVETSAMEEGMEDDAVTKAADAVLREIAARRLERRRDPAQSAGER